MKIIFISFTGRFPTCGQFGNCDCDQDKRNPYTGK
jgi:hypothetical protein